MSETTNNNVENEVTEPAAAAATTTEAPAEREREPRRGGRERNANQRDRGSRDADKSQFLERVVTINRVSKVVKGGRRFSFTALVVVGDGNGVVGVGYGKAREVPLAISKGVEEAKRNFFRVPRAGSTIPHPVQGEAAAGVVLLRPLVPVPVSSPAVRSVPSSSARASTMSSRSRSARRTRSTSSTRRWRR
nr:hypothetical protein GCM10025699_03310 [Microbacterium flavescens]